MVLQRIPKLKELGAVGGMLQDIYGEARGPSLSYQTIVTAFEQYESSARKAADPNLGLLLMFDPRSVHTERFFENVRRHGFVSLDAVVSTMRQGQGMTFPSTYIAEGILRTRLNLPHPIYEALDETFLAEWVGKKGTHHDVKGEDRKYSSTVYKASQRYFRALQRLERVLQAYQPRQLQA